MTDYPWGWFGLVRIPRHPGEESWWSWRKNGEGVWQIVHTDPALPNFSEILWNERDAFDHLELIPFVD
jgi:hypothetical protein